MKISPEIPEKQLNRLSKFKQVGYFEILFNAASVILLVIFCVLSPFTGITEEGMRTIGIFCFALTIWMTDKLDTAVSSLIILLLIPTLGVMPFKEVFSVFGSSLLWMLLGIMILSVVIADIGLDKRIAFSFIRLAGDSVQKVFGYVIVTGFIFCFLVPMSLGRCVMQFPVFTRIIKSIGPKGQSNIGKVILLAVVYISVLGSVAVITGANGVIYSVGLYEEMLGFYWDYITWFLAFFPIPLVISCTLYIILPVIFPFEVKTLSGENNYILQELKKLGRLTRFEKKFIIMFTVLLLLWVFGQQFGIPIEYSTLLITTILVIPGIGVISWKKVSNRLNWGNIFIFASSLALAKALQVSGVAEWLGAHLSILFKGIPIYWLSFLLLIMMSLLRFVFTTVLGFVASVLPILFHVAVNLDLNPVWLGMVGICGSVLSVLFPTQSTENLLAYQTGYFSRMDMVKAGIPLLFIYSTIVTAFAFLYWPLLGIHIYK